MLNIDVIKLKTITVPIVFKGKSYPVVTMSTNNNFSTILMMGQ